MADGRWLALGAVAVVAAAGAVRRSRRGSGVKLYRQTEVNDLIESLQEAQGHYGRKSQSREGDAYEFTIKAHRAWPPDEMSRRIPDRVIAQQIGDLASSEIEWFVEGLRERYPWIAKKWETDGRQGGYLLIFDEGQILGDLENLNLDPTIVRHSFRGQTPVMEPDRAREIQQFIETAKQRLKDLKAIEKEVEEAVKGFEEHIRDPETWESLLEIYAQDQDEDEEDEDG